MKVEKVIVEMAERRPAVAEVNKVVAECHESGCLAELWRIHFNVLARSSKLDSEKGRAESNRGGTSLLR